MKTSPLLRMAALALGLGALPLVATRAFAAIDAADPTTDHLWSPIKDDAYEQRAHFADGARKLLLRLDSQIGELRAKRAAMTTDTKDWDFAMKEVDDSRVMLAGSMNDLAQATTPDVWTDCRDKVGVAWRRSQAAVDKMNSTRTS